MAKDSRLEKFLKALCSLDYSDLPTPLSRVELLWNCLITGEATPDFQPQSRTEKYLMTILGVYDLEDIPKPISRAETLLYKLATGDTDVELEDGAKSIYERLLSEIVANGGVGDNVDFEYVTYVLSESFNTLYNTVEKPAESAVLTGQTLVNVSKPTFNNGKINNKYSLIGQITDMVKTNTIYHFKIFNKTNTKLKCYIGTQVATNLLQINVDANSFFSGTFTSLNNFSGSSWLINDEDQTVEQDVDIILIEYQDGMENWDIPYFEGMQSVKMPVLTTTGKNLFDGNVLNVDRRISTSNGYSYASEGYSVSSYVPVKPNKRYTLTTTEKAYVAEYDKNKTFVRGYALENGKGATTLSNVFYIRFDSPSDDLDKAQIEYGSVATSYQPHKSNILTVNEDVTLRSNGDVYDELNLLTGRLTQRIDENNEVLSQEVVKTVDLSVVNQDGNDTKLSTFDDLTHITLSSEGLIPEAELEVATKNEELL